jgi:hypothetical protein
VLCPYLRFGDRSIRSHDFIAREVWLFSKARGFRFQKDVVHGNYSRERAIVRNHWQTAYLPRLHRLQRNVNIIIRATIEELL